MTANDSLNAQSHQSLVRALFSQLCGTWNLDRQLQSANASDPSGKCCGNTTFKPREPSVWVSEDGKLELASAEMVYEEQGDFEMRQTSPLRGTNLRFPFSKKYVWRLQQQDSSQSPTLTVWFVKPGTETVDYLFHKVDITSEVTNAGVETATTPSLEGHGGHLCINDFYSSSYIFNFEMLDTAALLQPKPRLTSWTTIHEVRGPRKDQVIETRYTKAADSGGKL